MSLRVVVRCDGSNELGLGHVVRCLAVAAELRAQGASVSFAMREGGELVRREGFAVHDLPGLSEVDEIAAVLEAADADVLFLDVRRDLDRIGVEALRDTGAAIGILDDLDDRRLAADVSFHPPVPQVRRLDWAGSSCTPHAGWEWVALRPAFARPPARPAGSADPLVLVAMGGSDPAGLTLVALEALAGVEGRFEVDVLVGAHFAFAAEAQAALDRLGRPGRLLRDVADVPAAMVRADLAIASFGMTAYELAACGVPALHLCLTDCHAESSSAFADAGIAVSLGRYDTVGVGAIRDAAAALAADETRRDVMAAGGRALVDGLGARRIAAELLRIAQAPRAAADNSGVPAL